MIALWLEVIVPAVTVNVPEDRPAATGADNGTIKPVELLLVRLMLAPPDGAGPFSVTVQVAIPELNVLGKQDKETTDGSAPPVTVPLVALKGILAAEGEDATVLVRLNAVELTPTAIVTLITATMPFEMPVWFRPETTQMYVPVPDVQVKFFEALVAALPALTEIAATLPGG